jgi:hypothetical protein
MLFKKKQEVTIDKFWQEFELSTGEKVLAKSLGKYICGWAGYDYELWGLAIATSGGFRFHHFPHEGWLSALSRITTGGEAPKEKTFFVPKESIQSAELILEKRWWKKILTSPNPLLVICCSVNGTETRVMIETDRSAAAVVDVLKAENS